MAKRLNLTLPADLWDGLRARARRRRVRPPELARQFVSEGLRRLDGADLETELRRAYQALAAEDRRILREFRAVDLEGWE